MILSTSEHKLTRHDQHPECNTHDSRTGIPSQALSVDPYSGKPDLKLWGVLSIGC